MPAAKPGSRSSSLEEPGWDARRLGYARRIGRNGEARHSAERAAAASRDRLIAVRRNLPGPILFCGRAAANALDPITMRRFRRRTGRREPLPGRALRASVGAPGVEAYATSGRLVASELLGILRSRDLEPRPGQRVYEFGCGTGRVLTHVLAAGAASLAGSDLNEPAIRWLARHYPRIDARPNAQAPPTTFADAEFDLVYSISVFTHLDRVDQDLWLGELARVLAPGAHGLITVLGERLRRTYAQGARPGLRPSEMRAMRDIDLAGTGHAFVPAQPTVWNPWQRRVARAGQGLAFHDHAYIRSHWGRWFDVVEIVPDSINWGQDAVIVRRS